MATQKFSVHATITAIPYFISFARPASLYCEEYCICIDIYIWLRRNFIWNTFASKLHHVWNIFTQIFSVRSVDRIFITGVPDWRWLGENVTLDRTFYCLLFKQEVVAAVVTPTFLPYSIAPGENIVTVRHCFALTIPIGTRKDFFEIYTLLAHSSSKIFTNPQRNSATCRIRSTQFSVTGFI